MYDGDALYFERQVAMYAVGYYASEWSVVVAPTPNNIISLSPQPVL